MSFRSDNPIEIKLNQYKAKMGGLESKINRFSVIFISMKPQDRASEIQSIQNLFKEYEHFIDSVQPVDLLNASLKFSFETFKSKFYLVRSRWKAIEGRL